jgi:hypothetical protein
MQSSAAIKYFYTALGGGDYSFYFYLILFESLTGRNLLQLANNLYP